MEMKSLAPIYSTLADDPEMAELVEMFVDEAPEKLERLETLLAAEDWDELKRLAHQLKGAAGGYGFAVVTDCAQRLESTLQKQDDVEVIQLRAQELISLLAAIR